MMPENKIVNITLWLIAVVLLGSGIAANYYFSSVDISLRLIGWLVLAIIIGAIVQQTRQGHTAWEFAKTARTELRKVIWPSRQETLQMTAMVIILVIIIAILIWGIDTLFLHLVGFLTGQ